MWDEVTLLRNASNALFALSLLMCLYGILHFVVHMPGLLPISTVRLISPPTQVDADDVLQVVRQDVQGNLFTVNLARLRTEIGKLPWVRGVDIHRDFPDSLLVGLEEHKAMAHWNNDELVNVQGEVFNAESDENLPSFIGQPGDSEEVTQQYQQFSAQLATDGLHIVQIAESPRHAWQLALDNGMELELGSEDMQQRLDRFVAIYPFALAHSKDPVKIVDLRYHDGFSVTFGSDGKVNKAAAENKQ